MEKIKIGFVGVGGMGQMAHLSNYAELTGHCEVVALAEPRPRMARLVADRYGIPNVYDNHLQLLEHANVDAIVAPQQFRNHIHIIPDILRAGIPVLTEKPLSLTVEAGRELVRIGEERGVLHMIGYHKRSDPAMIYAKKVVDDWKSSEDYGKLRYIRVTMPPGDWIAGADRPLGTDEAYPAMTPETGPAGYTEQQTAELEDFVNYYIHQVNAIRFFLGEDYQLTYADKSGVLLVGESSSGVTVVLEMAPYRTSHDWHESVLMTFDQGFVRVDLPAPLVRQQAGKVTVMQNNTATGESSVYSPVMPNISAMRNQAINFIAAVKGERPAPCVAAEALKDLIFAQDYIDYRTRHYS